MNYFSKLLIVFLLFSFQENIHAKKDPKDFLKKETELTPKIIKMKLPLTFGKKSRQEKEKLLSYLRPLEIDPKLNFGADRIISPSYPFSSFLRVVIEKPYKQDDYKKKDLLNKINTKEKSSPYTLLNFSEKTLGEKGLLIHLKKFTGHSFFEKYLAIFGNKKHTIFVAALYPENQNKVLIRRLQRTINHSSL